LGSKKLVMITPISDSGYEYCGEMWNKCQLDHFKS